ncbi:AAA family ATPase [Nonomuraea sp. NPDC050663]|uniref:AAA family ATPase n=1 Tax=Nonomuraea sp. NPDC050663 TaxID=3364370 RepID=UPI00379F6CE2
MDELLAASPALPRLRWLLAGLDGRWAVPPDVGEAMSPAFAFPHELFLERTRERAGRFSPIRVVGVDAEGCRASARFRDRDGGLWVAHVEVEPEPPHRITTTHTQGWVPDYLTPRLPEDFSPDRLEGAGGVLLVFAGLPGSGKSTVAERVGAELGIPVFALDWLLGALSPFGLRHHDDLMALGNELLTTLAYRELAGGRSAVLDTTGENPADRARWESLADAASAAFVPVVCVCGDRHLHRQRVEGRRRGIPGWHDAGDWDDVRARLESFPPWPGALVVDTARPLQECVASVLDAVGPPLVTAASRD